MQTKDYANHFTDRSFEINNTNTNKKTAYHIILDVDFHSRDNLYMNKHTHGSIRNHISDCIPVVFNLTDAKHIAKKMVDAVINLGSCKNKRYPVFGAIILELELSNINSIIEIDIFDNNGGRNYKKLLDRNEELKIYTIYNNNNEYKRGWISKQGYNKTKLLSARYECILNKSCDVGFSLLNLNAHLTVEDIYCMKCIYDWSKQDDNKFYPIHSMDTLLLKPIDGTHIEMNNEQESHDNNEQYHNAHSIQKNNMTGGKSHIDEEEMYRKLYKRQKAIYLKLQKQKRNK